MLQFSVEPDKSWWAEQYLSRLSLVSAHHISYFSRLNDYLLMMKDIDEILKELIELDEAMLLLDSEPDSEQYYIISGSGWGWFLDPETKTLARIPRGTEVVPMPGEPDDRGRLLVRAPGRFLLIPEFEVQDIGWN